MDPITDPQATPPQATPPVEAPPTIDPSEFEKYKAEAAKAKADAAKLKAELDHVKINALKSSQNWEEIAKLKEKEAEDAKAELASLSQGLINSHKNSALRDAAAKAGIRPESMPDLELFDFSELIVETTSTGKVLVQGADRAIARLKQMRPHWFASMPAKVDATSPQALPAQNGFVTLQDVENAQAHWAKVQTPEAAQAYKELISKFKTQKQL